MHLPVLHRLRGIAALYVVVVHACTLLWTWTPEGVDTAWPSFVVSYLLGFPHQAVLLFFVISGFCIHQRQAGTVMRRLDLATFAGRRVKRLWPPLAIALVLTAICDALGAWIDPGLYAPLGVSHSVSTFLGNLLMQSQLAVPVFGTNIPLWSLGVEGWLYALYPLLLVVFARVGVRRSFVLVSAISVGSEWMKQTVTWWPLDVLSAWAIWSVGALLAELHARRLCDMAVRRFGRVGLGALLVIAVMSTNSSLRERIPDAAWGLALGVAVTYTLQGRRQTRSTFSSRFSAAFLGADLSQKFGRLRLVPKTGLSAELLERRQTLSVPIWLASRLDLLGDVSYSLYLTHFPFLVLVAAVWRSIQGPIPAAPTLALAGIVASLVPAGLVWWTVERRCATARSTAYHASQPNAMARTVPSALSSSPMGSAP
jgi:peptidoglycan/LPS O-acetylase OafA/YrhL